MTTSETIPGRTALPPAGATAAPSHAEHAARRPDLPSDDGPPALTLIVPAHNEAERIEATLHTSLSALRERYGARAEVMVVANGCTDDTLGVVDRVRRRAGPDDPALRTVNIEAPVRKGGALIEGFRQARGDIVVFADADGSTETSSLLGLADDLADHDVVAGSRWLPGSRIERAQPLQRRLLSRCFNLAVRSLFGFRMADTQCGAKAMRRPAARALAAHIEERDWAFDVDLLLWARRLGMIVAERPVTWSDADGSRLRVASTAKAVLGSLARLKVRELRLDRRGVAPRPTSGGARQTRPSATRRRILAINWRDPRHPEAGGAELNLFEQARRWRRDGAMVTVLAARRAGDVELPREDVIDGVRVRRMGDRFTVYPLVAWFLLRHGRRYSHVLDVANGIPFFAPLFARRPATLLVHHVHGRQWFMELPKPLAAVGWLLERFVVPHVYRRQAVIAVSPTTRDALVETGVPAEHVEIVYNGMSAPTPPARTRRSRPHIAYVGRLKRYKRLDRLVRIFAEVRANRDVRLEIAGDGDARPEIEATIDELGLHDAVTLHGRVDEPTKSDILESAVAFATPSMQEGWGLSVIEANQLGCPAVAYDVPGLSAAIRHGETGLLAKDDEGFRDALEQLIDDPALREDLSNAAREWAATFDWDETSQATLGVLDRSFDQWREIRHGSTWNPDAPLVDARDDASDDRAPAA